MSAILHQITIGSFRIAVVDQDPRTGDGLDLVIGSLAMVKDQGGIYQKTGAGVNDWTLSSVDIENLKMQDLADMGIVDPTAGQILSYDDVQQK